MLMSTFKAYMYPTHLKKYFPVFSKLLDILFPVYKEAQVQY